MLALLFSGGPGQSGYNEVDIAVYARTIMRQVTHFLCNHTLVLKFDNNDLRHELFMHLCMCLRLRNHLTRSNVNFLFSSSPFFKKQSPIC